MYKLILFFTITIYCFQASGQQVLTGKITDARTHETLPGTSVYLPDLKTGCTSDAGGKYRLANLPSGQFVVEVKFLGYETQILKVKISGNTIMDFEMNYMAAEINEVVITGVSSATEKRSNPVPSLVVNRSDLALSSSANIIDAIAKKPGISQITTGGAISKPVIRGLGYNRVVVLNNGIRQEGQQWGDEHGIEIDEFSIDRVEVIKGPGSLMYGSDAMAGVINLLGPNPVDEGTINARLMTNYQTNNGLMGASANVSGNIKGFNWLLRGSGKRAGNYSNNYDGKVYNSGFNEVNINGYAGINRRWGYSQIVFSRFSQHIGMAEGERDSLGCFIRPVILDDSTLGEEPLIGDQLNGYTLGVPKQEISHLELASNNNFIIGQSRLTATIGYQQNERKELADPFDPKLAELDFFLQTASYDLKYFFPEYNGWEISLGSGGMLQNNTNKGIEFLIPEYRIFDAGFFTFAKRKFGRLNLSGGARIDFRNLKADGLWLDEQGVPVEGQLAQSIEKFIEFDRQYSNVSASIGGSYSFTPHLIAKVNVSRGFRAPNMSELASNGRHEGTYRYELGNPELKAETSLQTDAGFLYNSEHVSIEIDLFNNRINHFIFPEKLNSIFGGDSISDVSDPAPTFKYVQGNANLLGGEVLLDIHPHPYDWIHFENSFSLVRGIQLNRPDSMQNLPFVPAPRFTSGLRADIKKAGKYFRNISSGINLNYTFKQPDAYEAFGTETITPGYLLLDAGISAQITDASGQQLFSLSLQVTNILNKAYQDHLSRLKYAPENPLTHRTGIYNMGRNLSLRLMIPIEWKIAKK